MGLIQNQRGNGAKLYLTRDFEHRIIPHINSRTPVAWKISPIIDL